MSNLNCTEQSSTAMPSTMLEQIGFELGWDYAHHQVLPPVPYADEPSPLHDGLRAGQAAYGERTLAPTRYVRQWLQLRLNAWLRGRSVETFQVTPHYLQQIEASHCPITRVALSNPSDASVDRVRNDAGYAAGNLAVLSVRADQAKAAHGFRSASQIARRLGSVGLDDRDDRNNRDGTAELAAIDGLNAAEWGRVAVLCSFVEALPHAEACALPMLLLPPNRLRLFNPVQALQALLSRQFLKDGWSQRLRGIEALLPAAALQHDFRLFVMALLPRMLEAGKPVDTVATRQAVEDAWNSPLVQRRWTAFACQLTAAQCKTLLQKASVKKLATTAVELLGDAQATDGWNLASRGYVANVPELAPVTAVTKVGHVALGRDAVQGQLAL